MKKFEKLIGMSVDELCGFFNQLGLVADDIYTLYDELGEIIYEQELKLNELLRYQRYNMDINTWEWTYRGAEKRYDELETEVDNMKELRLNLEKCADIFSE
mgnify:CR=1 FL=1